jgi:adenylosuccinate lyase
MSNTLLAIGAYDGRYANKTNELCLLASQYAFTRNRIIIAATHFIKLIKVLGHESKVNLDLWEQTLIKPFENDIVNHIDALYNITDSSGYRMVSRCIEIEKKTNHDVAAIIELLKEQYDEHKIGPKEFKGYIHLGLTSQDLNTSANMMIMKDFREIWHLYQSKMVNSLRLLNDDYTDNYMLGFTHGQSATPTTFKWAFNIFIGRINNIMPLVHQHKLATKFGGATGGFNSLHSLALEIDWNEYGNKLCNEFGLIRNMYTSQVDSYDSLLVLLSYLHIFNQILYDMCQDIWHYVSRGVLCLKLVDDEVGSSAMPHKVNPIHFENAMGNISITNNFIQAMQSTLSVSIMQRDLRDSTILRQLGNLLSGSLVAWKSIIVGLDRLKIDKMALRKEIDENIVVVSEGLQTILRFCGNDTAYNDFKTLTRGQEINKELLLNFVNEVTLDPEFIKIAYNDTKSVDDVRNLMRNVIDKPEIYFTNKPIPKE